MENERHPIKEGEKWIAVVSGCEEIVVAYRWCGEWVGYIRGMVKVTRWIRPIEREP